MNTPKKGLEPAFAGKFQCINGGEGGSTPPSSTTQKPGLTPSQRQAELYGTYTGHGFDHLYAEEEARWEHFCNYVGLMQTASSEHVGDYSFHLAIRGNSRHLKAKVKLEAAIAQHKKQISTQRSKLVIPILLASCCISLPLLYLGVRTIWLAVSGQ